MEVGAWLRGLGLGRYERAFRDNEIDAEILPRLTADDLREIGVAAIGHRRKLLAAIETLGPAPAVPSPSAEAAVEIRGERRHVVVLFADLAGYTALSRELDAEEVHALLGRFFERADRVIEVHGGHIDKHIGDCVMAVFGAPLAHGNDAERAVRAALALRDAMPEVSAEPARPVDVHVGIASGQVVASGTGSARHREYTVTGETVNLASRLTGAAAAGEILLSEQVQRLLGERLRCQEVGALPVKGYAEPVRAWRLLGLREAVERRPFAGRRGELRQFRAALAACRDTGRGRAIHVRGEAGIGKSRLLEEVRDAACGLGFLCHTALMLDFGADGERDAVPGLVRAVLGLEAVGDAAAKAAVDGGLVAAEEAVFLNDLLGLPQPAALRSVHDAMDNDTRIAGKRRLIVGLVERASRRRPRLLAVEDVHWADRPTLAYLAALADAVATCPALLVTTARPEGDPLDANRRAPVGTRAFATVELGPLRPDEARTLAGAFAAAGGAFAERCVERAAGNPLFLEQLLRYGEDAEAEVPASVQGLVQARLDRLDPTDRAAVHAASVLGPRFDREALGHLLARPDYAPERLEAHALVRPHEGGFLFAHALIRDAAYESLLRSRRRELHHRAAAWFAGRDPALHAVHLDRAEDPGAPRAYLAAARSQAAEHRYEAALDLVRRGAALATAGGERFALELLRGDVLHDLGDMPEAGRAYEAALGVAPDEPARCRARIGLAAVRLVTADPAGAFAELARAGAAAAAHGLVAERARVHLLRGNLHFWRGDLDGCLGEHGRSLDLARRAGRPDLEAAALGGLGDAEYVRGRMISAHDRLRECVALCRRHGLARVEVANRAQIAHASLYFRPQREVADEALAAAEAAARVGHRRAELGARLAALFALFLLAEFGRCREELARVEPLTQGLGAWRFEQTRLLYLGRIAHAEGRRAEAAGLLRRALEASRRTEPAFIGPQILGALARALVPAEERSRCLAEAEATIGGGCAAHNQLQFYPDAIEVGLEIGDRDKVERYASRLEDFARDEPLPWTGFHAARGRALAASAGGRRDAAIGAKLRRLQGKGERLGLRVALPAIVAALGRGPVEVAGVAPGGPRPGGSSVAL